MIAMQTHPHPENRPAPAGANGRGGRNHPRNIVARNLHSVKRCAGCGRFISDLQVEGCEYLSWVWPGRLWCGRCVAREVCHA